MGLEVKVGISGLGRSGWNIHAATLGQLAGKFKVVAVADPLESRLQEARERFGCRTYADFRGLLRDEEVELVVVATPSHLHAEQSVAALEAGKDVVCEKPMAASLAEADEMVRAAERSGRLLVVFHNSLFAPDYLKVKEVVRSGRLGRVVLVKIYSHWFGRRWDWQTLKRFGGGELRNNAVHSIVQGLELMGDVEPEVFCDLQRTLTLGDAEDHVKLILRAVGAPLVDIEVTRACAYPQEKWLVMGTQGGLTGTQSSLRWKYFNPADLPPREVETEPTPDRSYNVEEIPWSEEAWAFQAGDYYRSSHLLFYESLYDALRRGAPPPVPLSLAHRVMRVVDRCYSACAGT